MRQRALSGAITAAFNGVIAGSFAIRSVYSHTHHQSATLDLCFTGVFTAVSMLSAFNAYQSHQCDLRQALLAKKEKCAVQKTYGLV